MMDQAVIEFVIGFVIALLFAWGKNSFFSALSLQATSYYRHCSFGRVWLSILR